MKNYHNVRLGRLNHVNGPATYPFPNRRAAIGFAENESTLHPGRLIIVRNPEGRIIKKYGTKKRSTRP